MVSKTYEKPNLCSVHTKLFSCESHKKSCTATRFLREKVTHDKMPNYIKNRVFMRNSLGFNPMVFRLILTKNCMIKPIFCVTIQKFRVKTA